MFSIQTICICGAGTMGCGISQVMAQSGYPVLLFDADPLQLEKAKGIITRNLQRMADKNELPAARVPEIHGSIRLTSLITDCRADVIIEAIIENQDAKAGLLKKLGEINAEETLFATNTSSLSISALAAQLEFPERLAGMHFFNPAPVMKLVEIVEGEKTGGHTIRVLSALAEGCGKIPVICRDSPGFIVNRVARQYYLEALKLAELGIADVETIDTLLEAAGFKMGPFRLMDLIGNDINLAVTRSLYEAFHETTRFKPSPIQEMKVKIGALGRKTGRGYYPYQ
jgi:3-hydroxybutyryl-CoA dehydrogenase